MRLDAINQNPVLPCGSDRVDMSDNKLQICLDTHRARSTGADHQHGQHDNEQNYTEG
jgi:hypothetical protein